MYDIIVNPMGGKGKSLKALKQVCKILDDNNKPYAVHRTEYAAHATEIVRSLSSAGECNVIVLGGDGSFSEALNGIENFDNVTLGLVPCGTGNDFVSASGHPKKVKDAMERILSGNRKYVDYIQLSDRRCLNVLGAGMDVDVLLKYAEMKRFKGKMKYYAALLYTLAHTRWHKLRLAVDGGEPVEKSVFMIGIGNGRSIGGGMPICPNAKVDDGKLSIVVVNEMKKSHIPLSLLAFLSGSHVKHVWAEEITGTSVKIEVLDDSRFESDGEVFEADVIDACVVGGKLRVFA